MDICNDMPRVFAFIGYLILIFQIAVPIIIVILGTIDLSKAMMSGKVEEIKKHQTMLIKRIIIGVVIFFIPVIVYFVIGLAGGDNVRDNRCFSCVSDPRRCMEDILVDESGTTVECTDYTGFESRTACCVGTHNNERYVYDFRFGCGIPDLLGR